jgi:hypothetical protein
MDQELTQQQARKLRLPDHDPINSEPIVWAPILAPRKDFEEAARLLGDGRAA